ncbi:MAG: hypothetical protein EBR82_56300 [Caulobacteraceae bacterium]|nr:hypothetical protein [Caulobacteraceae bacterium]
MIHPPTQFAAFLPARARAARLGQRPDTAPNPGAHRAEIALCRASGAPLPDTIRAAWDVMVAEYLPHTPGGALTAAGAAGLHRQLARDLGITAAEVAAALAQPHETTL